MFADWLPYRSFDPKTGLYYNSASRGFILEVSPLVGADDQTSEIIAQFLSEGIPDKTSIQILQWMSRSEENTSELQSLMRISYAVFCLTKKIPIKNTNKAQNTKPSTNHN